MFDFETKLLGTIVLYLFKSKLMSNKYNVKCLRPEDVRSMYDQVEVFLQIIRRTESVSVAKLSNELYIAVKSQSST